MGDSAVRLANLDGRAALLYDRDRDGVDRAVDVAKSSGDRFGPDLPSVYDDWAAFTVFAAGVDPAGAEPYDRARLGAPVMPRQVFAIGLNFRSHAEESGMAVPEVPATFTKFPACLTGPWDDVVLSGGTVDWEAELVAVIGERADSVAEADAWAHVAGLTVGQDISDRTLQFAAGGQFSMGKSYRTYGPTGPWLVTTDELDDPDDLALRCAIDGEVLQDARTSDLIFSVPRLVAELSAVLPLLPGDVIFTGTPAGVGITRQPPRFLQPGDVLETTIDGVGTIRNRMVKP
jgi:2-keto-4-pentenoate hydratase/2-oxohepta-3-ene-1,7-dioic acid hydratase in catechol pathway